MRLIPILVALLLLAPPQARAQVAAVPAAPAAAAPDAAEAARLLADVIEDPASRDALVKQLRLAAEGTPVAEPAPPLDQSITAAVAGHTLGIAEGISQGVIALGRMLTDFDGMRALDRGDRLAARARRRGGGRHRHAGHHRHVPGPAPPDAAIARAAARAPRRPRLAA